MPLAALWSGVRLPIPIHIGISGRIFHDFVEKKKPALCPLRQNAGFWLYRIIGGLKACILPSLFRPPNIIKTGSHTESFHDSKQQKTSGLPMNHPSKIIIPLYMIFYDFWPPGNHSTKCLRPYGFASPPLDGFALKFLR